MDAPPSLQKALLLKSVFLKNPHQRQVTLYLPSLRDGKAFAVIFAPEQEIDMTAEYTPDQIRRSPNLLLLLQQGALRVQPPKPKGT